MKNKWNNIETSPSDEAVWVTDGRNVCLAIFSAGSWGDIENITTGGGCDCCGTWAEYERLDFNPVAWQKVIYPPPPEEGR